MSPTVKQSLKHTKQNLIFLDSSDENEDAPQNLSYDLNPENILANINSQIGGNSAVANFIAEMKRKKHSSLEIMDDKAAATKIHSFYKKRYLRRKNSAKTI